MSYLIKLNGQNKTITLKRVQRDIKLYQTGRVGPQGPAGANGAPGATGATGPQGPQGDPGVVQSIVAGTNVTVDDTDPANPIVSASGGGGGAVDSVNGQTGVVVLDKTDIGLGNVDNTSDANKPISTATQTALDGKVDENAPITGATKTKITYDAKGLVTAGADATTADIADSSNKRYVTDAQLTVIGNTSGTNTGDQDLSGLVPYTGATGNVNLGSNTLTTPDVLTTDVQATGSAGIIIKNSGGTQQAEFGSGGGTNATINGTTNIGNASADYHQVAGGTGTITDTATGSSSNININLVPKGTGRLQSGGVNVPTVSSTDTMTNKRRTRRIATTNAPGATPTTNTDNVDIQTFTGLNAAITSMTTNLSGTPVDGDLIEFRFVDDGTPRAITWGSSFTDSGTVSMPTTTVASTVLRVGFEYSTIASINKWICIAKA